MPPDIGVAEDSGTWKVTSDPALKYLSTFRRVIMPPFSGSTRFLLVLVDPVSV